MKRLLFSALIVHAFLSPAHAADYSDLRVTEIMYHPAGDGALEFVEMMNRGTNGLDMAGLRWTGGIDFAFPDGGELAPGQIVVLGGNESPGGLAARYPGVEFFGYFTRKLSNGGDQLTLVDGNGSVLYHMAYDDAGFWPSRADGGGASLALWNDDLNPNDPAAWRASPEVHGNPGQVSSPGGLPLVYFDEIYAFGVANPEAPSALRGDWIELRNGSRGAIDVSGWTLTDDPAQLGRYVFPPGTTLPGGGAMVLAVAPETIPGGVQLPFGLNVEGETLLLRDGLGEVVDLISFGPQAAGFSIIRNADQSWAVGMPGPGGPSEVAPAAPLAAARLNEWMADSIVGEADWIELYNADPDRALILKGAIAKRGLVSQVSTVRRLIPMEGEWRLFKGLAHPSPEGPIAWAQRSFSDSEWPLVSQPLFYGETAAGGTELTDMRDGYSAVYLRRHFTVDNVEDLINPRFRVRIDDGFSIWINGFEWGRLNVASVGTEHDKLALGAVPEPLAVGEFVINNVQSYFRAGENVVSVHAVNAGRNDDDFFFELELIADGPDEERFQVDRRSALHPATVIAPGGFARLWADESGENDSIGFRISAAAGFLELSERGGARIDHVEYSAQSEGLSQGRVPDGSGPVRFLIQGGTPGASNIFDQDQDGLPDDWELSLGLNPNEPSDADGDLDGDGATNLDEHLAGTDAADPESFLRLRVVAHEPGKVTLGLLAMRGKGYAIMMKNDLSTGAPWRMVARVLPRTITGEDIIELEVDEEAGPAFYALMHPFEVNTPADAIGSFSPTAGSVSEGFAPPIRLALAVPLDGSGLSQNLLRLRDSSGNVVEGVTRFYGDFSILEFEAVQPLFPNTVYELGLNSPVQTVNGLTIEDLPGLTFFTPTAPPIVDEPSVYAVEDRGQEPYQLYVKVLEELGGHTLEDVLNDDYYNDDFEPFVPVHFSDEPIPANQTPANGELEARGHSTRLVPMKSFNVHLDGNVVWRGLADLQLNKHPYDLTRLLNRLSFELFREVPNFTSLRMAFVNLFIDGADYGLFSLIERYDEDFLARRGFGEDSHLYKAENFSWWRNPAALKVRGDPDFDEAAFEAILQPRGNEDHGKLIEMLDDVNDDSLDFATIMGRHFHRDNFMTWLAINVLMSNKDTISQNYFIYSPADSRVWYFLPWDYDGSLGWLKQPLEIGKARERWRSGIANWWNVLLINRFLRDARNVADLQAKMEALLAGSLAADNIQALIDRDQPLVEQFIAMPPDSTYLPVTSEARQNGTVLEEYRQTVARLPGEPERNYQEYVETLGRPMPVFLGVPEVAGGGVTFRWSQSFDLQGDAIVYDFQVSSTPDFALESIEAEQLGLSGTSTVVSAPLRSGKHFFRIIIRDQSNPAENWQAPFDRYVDPDTGVFYFGTRAFTIP